MSETRKLAAKKPGRENAQGGPGAMLAACRLVGLSALEAHYAGVDAYAQMLTTSRHCAGRASYSDVTEGESVVPAQRARCAS
jgi:hypothetical protein